MDQKQDFQDPKRYRCERFHSKLLIPWTVAQKVNKTGDIEHALLWIDTYQDDYRFKEGESVAHRANLQQELFVQKILTSPIKMASGTTFNKMIGILCHWFENCPCVEDVKQSHPDQKSRKQAAEKYTPQGAAMEEYEPKHTPGRT